jgi:hypothetical protein
MQLPEFFGVFLGCHAAIKASRWNESYRGMGVRWKEEGREKEGRERGREGKKNNEGIVRSVV